MSGERVALVTGGSSGIGLAAAKALANSVTDEDLAEGRVIPDVFDKGAFEAVSSAVASAAVRTGAVRKGSVK